MNFLSRNLSKNFATGRFFFLGLISDNFWRIFGGIKSTVEASIYNKKI